MKNKDEKYYFLKGGIKHNFIGAVIVIVFGIVFTLLIQNGIEHKKEFLKNAKETVATIKNIDYKSSEGEKKIDRVYIEYYVNGRKYTDVLKEHSERMSFGDKVDIYYNVSNPEEFIQYNEIKNNIYKYAGYGIILLGIYMLGYAIKELSLYITVKNCQEVQATVTNVLDEGNQFYKKFIIECEWTDNAGIKYTFYSKAFHEPYFYKEFEKMGINELPVRFKNSKKYIVITQEIDKKLSK